MEMSFNKSLKWVPTSELPLFLERSEVGSPYTNNEDAAREITRRWANRLASTPNDPQFKGKDDQFLGDTIFPGGVFGGYTNSEDALVESARRGVQAEGWGVKNGRPRNPLLQAILQREYVPYAPENLYSETVPNLYS